MTSTSGLRESLLSWAFLRSIHDVINLRNLSLLADLAMSEDDLVKAIVENYENMDIDTQRLLPLKKLYWPA